MAIPTGQAVAAARDWAGRGYFARVQAPDERAASYFARFIAYVLNPNGDPASWGVLRKTGGGFNVEGYADGAIVYGSNPNDFNNVVKLVTQIGTTHAGIGDAIQPRRESDVWEAPKPLTFEQMRYLNPAHQGGETSSPPPPQQPPPAVVDLSPVMAKLALIEAGLHVVNQRLDDLRPPDVADLTNQVADVRKALQNGIAINASGSNRILGTITITGVAKG